MRSGVLAGLLLALLSTFAGAAEKSDECQGQIATPPADLSAWAAPVQAGIPAGATAAAAPMLAPGQAAELALRPEGQVTFVVTPGKKGDTAGFAGLFTFTVDRPGTWRVALGKAAWVDVVKDGLSVPSTAHGHGPACTGIRKIVEFPLTPGRHVLQLAASSTDRLSALILPPR